MFFTKLTAAMKASVTFLSITCSLLLSSCGLLGDSGDTPEPLDFAQMQVQYKKFGTWIPSSKLFIQPTGEASAELVGNGSGEVIDRGTAVLTSAERERLAKELAWFPRYRRSYTPSSEVKDSNVAEIILSYSGRVDTVTGSGLVAVPGSLERTSEELDNIYERVFDK